MVKTCFIQLPTMKTSLTAAHAANHFKKFSIILSVKSFPFKTFIHPQPTAKAVHHTIPDFSKSIIVLVRLSLICFGRPQSLFPTFSQTHFKNEFVCGEF
jgi:hypothetical protein